MSMQELIIMVNKHTKQKINQKAGDKSILIAGDLKIGIPHEQYLHLAKELGVTEIAIKNFFKIIEQKEVPKKDWDKKLRRIAEKHNELLSRLNQFNITVDPEIQELRLNAEDAINEFDYDSADNYLDDALDRQMLYINNAEKELKDAQKKLTNFKLSAAEMKVDKGDIEIIRINYKAATVLFKEAVELVPDDNELLKAEYLQKWGCAANYAGLYPDSQIALVQCFKIRHKLLPPNHPDLSAARYNLVRLNINQGKVCRRKAFDFFT